MFLPVLTQFRVQRTQKSLIHGSGPWLISSLYPHPSDSSCEAFPFLFGLDENSEFREWDEFDCTTLSALLSSREELTNVRKRSRIIKDSGGFRILNSSEIISNCIKLQSINQSGRITPN